MVKGKLIAVNGKRNVSTSGEVVMSIIDRGTTEVLTHVGLKHIQVIITVAGKEVFRRIWTED